LPDSERLRQDADLLFDVVREAGALAHTMQRQTVRRWTKPDGTPVTEADEAVDALLRGKLQAARPGYGWLSEETPDDATRLACETMWIADPIDGTRAFITGSSEWCIAVALISRGRPAAAAVYRPVREEFYAAIVGEGALLNGETIHIADDDSLADAHIVGTVKSLAPLAAHGIKTDVSGELPLQLRLAFVACGRFDGAVSFGHKNDWDLAAGDLIVHESGGRVGDLSGTPYIYNRARTWQQGMIAAGIRRHARIAEALRTP
jgi:myo-inositol-1(or 4)-monophosphatase